MTPKYSQIYCIKSTNFANCDFIADHIYNILYDKYFITIYGYNDKEFAFHIQSPFNVSMKKEYFRDMSEIRKQKLKKLKI